MNLCAIDPGKSGGIAYYIDGKIGITNLEHDVYLMYTQVYNIQYVTKCSTLWMVENVGYHQRGNAASSSATFARHCGHIEMALATFSKSVRYVNPVVWMDKSCGEGRPRDKTKRKKWIKLKMQERFPDLKVTLKTADALGILVYLALCNDVELP